MWRMILLCLFLMLPGIPLAAQQVTDGRATMSALKTAQVRPHLPGGAAGRAVSDEPVLRPGSSLAPFRFGAEQERTTCSPSFGRVLAGMALGLLLGGAAGFVYAGAGHPGLPHAGDDVPDAVVYVPLFATVGLVAGGFIASRTARCD